jgi:hypothetical protein
MRRFLALCAIYLVTAPTVADEIGDDLEAAKRKWELLTAAAVATLNTDIDRVIDMLAESGNLKAVNEVRKAKEEFNEASTIPSTPALAKAARAYRKARTTANEELSKGYGAAITAYTKAKLFDQAEAVSAERDEFAEKEAEHLGEDPIESLPRHEKSLKVLDAFANRFYEQLAAIAEESTSAKRDVAHNAMVKALDDEIRRKSIVVRLPIHNVDENSSTRGTYDIQFGTLEGYADIGHVDQHVTYLYEVPLKKDIALKTKQGDILELSGTPRFSAGYVNAPRTTELLTFRPRDLNDKTYTVYLQNYKLSIDHAK